MIIMRIMDIFLAIPGTLLAICIVASLGNSIPNLVIAQAVSSIPTFSRVVRGAVITARDADYVEAARAIGAKDATIIFHEVLPNSLGADHRADDLTGGIRHPFHRRPFLHRTGNPGAETGVGRNALRSPCLHP